MSGPMLVGAPGNLEIKARRRLTDQGVFDKLLDDLKATFEKHKDAPYGTVSIADCDLSQNHLTKDQLESLVLTVAAFNVRVHRFRLFGCPTLDDEAMQVIAQYIGMINEDTSFTEMHLSDCAITAQGFSSLISAIEESNVFPCKASPSSSEALPLYLRLENNYIEEAFLKAKVDEGVCRLWKKVGWSRRGAADPGVKVDIIVQQDGGLKQKSGPPPEPDKAPPPKEVWDKWNQPDAQQNQKGKGKGSWSQQSWQQPSWQAWNQVQSWAQKSTWHQQSWQQSQYGKAAQQSQSWQQPKGGQQQQSWQQSKGGASQVVRPGSGAAAAALANGGAARPGLIKPVAQQANAVAAGNANSRAADRSRTPAGARGNATKPLPPPWEEHWSDEYSIAYYWNPDTGDSLWERPDA